MSGTQVQGVSDSSCSTHVSEFDVQPDLNRVVQVVATALDQKLLLLADNVH